MGTMTSFFVAPTAELQSYKLSEGVPSTLPSVLCAYLDDIKVAILENVPDRQGARGSAWKALHEPRVHAQRFGHRRSSGSATIS
jgi:hypothetical protein